ncbi:MAG: SDR family NAD(P)-dependent oxidoreductase [Bradymonadia bacterium]
MSTGMERWSGQVALVTGASGGIGRATAKLLASHGMHVAAWARRLDALESLAEEAPGVVPQQVDLRDEAQIVQAFEAIRARWGGVDVLVNNAGLGHKAPLTTGQTHHWREMLEVNVLALCICTREALADIARRGDQGHVIHISSMAGHRVPLESGVYSATKYAVRSLTEGLRLELRAAGRQSRVTAISPGYVETGFAAHYHKSDAAAEATYGQYTCLQSEDVAQAVVYALGQPPHAQIHDILMRPTEQES